MTKEELTRILPKPFNYFVLNGSIDYKCNGRDHTFLEKLGYMIRMRSDGTYLCDKIPWFSLSSHGWGTMFSDTSDEGRQIFHDMWKSGIIKLWRGRIFTLTGDVIDYENGKFVAYDKTIQKWVKINNPFENDNLL